MGGAKRLMEEQQAQYDAGLASCLAVDAISECENHPGSYYEGSGDVEDALAKAKATTKKPPSKGLMTTTRELITALAATEICATEPLTGQRAMPNPKLAQFGGTLL